MNNHVVLKVNKNTIICLLSLYILTALYLLYFSPFCGRALTHRSLQLVPFKTIVDQVTMPQGFDLMLGNMIGNIIVLLPVGFFLALLGWEPRRGRRILLFMGTAFLVELIQFLFWVGCMDIDDIWMNGAGGLLGFFLGTRIRVTNRD
jgi:glycopeptide antibiotics resistance protein